MTTPYFQGHHASDDLWLLEFWFLDNLPVVILEKQTNAKLEAGEDSHQDIW